MTRRRHRRRPAGADARARRDPARALVPLPRPSPTRLRGEVGELLVGAYDDPELLDRLADGAAAVTYEFENVPVAAAGGSGAIPGAAALEASQDRLVEKQLFRRLGIPTPSSTTRSRVPGDPEDAPARLRRQGPASGGDVGSRRTPDMSWRSGSRSTASCRCSPFAAADGDTRFYPLVENVHEDGILRRRARRRATRRRREAEEYAGAAARRARLRRRARARALRRRRPPARERVRAARPQHRPLDDRGRGDEPVREPPARRPRAAARLDRARPAVRWST